MKDNEDPFDDPLVVDAVLVSFCDALYYNPVLTLNALQQSGSLFFVMTKLGEAVTKRSRKSNKLLHFHSRRYKKVVILGLSSIISAPIDALPPGLKDSIPQMAAAAVGLSVALQEQDSKRSKESSQFIADTSEIGGYSPDSGDDDEEDDDSWIDSMKKRTATSGQGEFEDEDDWSDYWDMFSDSDDEVEISSPLDNVSPFVFYGSVMIHLQHHDASLFASTVSMIDDASKSALEQIMTSAAAQGT